MTGTDLDVTSSVTSLVSQPATMLVEPVAGTEQIARAFMAYTALCERLLDAGDFQQIQGREFRKKSAWRKLAVAFGVSCTVAERLYDRQGDGTILRAEVLVRATAPNGRVMDGLGVCDRYEKCCAARTGGECKIGGRHKHCAPGCDGSAHFSHPEHDLPATAMCVPLDAEILTRRGFVRYDEAQVGEEVLAYDVAADACRWTPLRAVNTFGPSPVVELLNGKGFRAVCTPDHKWAVHKTKARVRTPDRELRPANRFKQGLRVILAAPGVEDGLCPMSPRIAAALGWIITDGTIRYDWRDRPRVHIDQSKPGYVEEIRELLGSDATESVYDQPPRTFPSGNTYAVMRSHRFNVSSAFWSTVVDVFGIKTAADLPPLVGYLTAEARAAMLDAMLKGDGSNKGRGGGWVFSQADHNAAVMETFQILATLQGNALGRVWRDRGQSVQTMRVGRHVESHLLRQTPLEPIEVWCPTTDLGTWVMRFEGQVSITGNTRATNRACSDLFGMGEVSAEEVGNQATEEQAHEQAPEPSADDRAAAKGFVTGDEMRETIAATRKAVADAQLQDWVRDQCFEWPWTKAQCTSIAAKATDILEAPFEPAAGKAVASYGDGRPSEHTADPTALPHPEPEEPYDAMAGAGELSVEEAPRAVPAAAEATEIADAAVERQNARKAS